MVSFPIIAPDGHRIRTLDEWLEHAPPAGRERQWRQDRSAKELARRWLPGVIPAEVLVLLDSHAAFRGFEAREALAEAKTRLDELRGNTRNQDLVVIGATADEAATLDIEGKADESFGATIRGALLAAHKYRLKKPGSMAAERIERLCAAVLGKTPPDVERLRYQLLHAVAAALIRAGRENASRTVLIVHEFRSAATDGRNLRRNAADLVAFVEALGGDPSLLQKGLAGPLRVRGGGRVPSGVDLYIGKAICHLPATDAEAFATSNETDRVP